MITFLDLPEELIREILYIETTNYNINCYRINKQISAIILTADFWRNYFINNHYTWFKSSRFWYEVSKQNQALVKPIYDAINILYGGVELLSLSNVLIISIMKRNIPVIQELSIKYRDITNKEVYTKRIFNAIITIQRVMNSRDLCSTDYMIAIERYINDVDIVNAEHEFILEYILSKLTKEKFYKLPMVANFWSDNDWTYYQIFMPNFYRVLGKSKNIGDIIHFMSNYNSIYPGDDYIVSVIANVLPISYFGIIEQAYNELTKINMNIIKLAHDIRTLELLQYALTSADVLEFDYSQLWIYISPEEFASQIDKINHNIADKLILDAIMDDGIFKKNGITKYYGLFHGLSWWIGNFYDIN